MNILFLAFICFEAKIALALNDLIQESSWTNQSFIKEHNSFNDQFFPLQRYKRSGKKVLNNRQTDRLS